MGQKDLFTTNEIAERFGNTLGDYEEVLVEQRTNLIELNAVRGLSMLRDGPYDSSTDTIGHTAQSGSITDNASEYKLSHPGSGNGDEAFLRSASRGRYQPGASSEVGIGIRLSTDSFGGDLDAKWGYFNTSSGTSIKEGFVFGYDSSGLYIQRWKGGNAKDVSNELNNSSTKIYEKDWDERPNLLSDNDINVKDGLIYQIRYNYYGYGEIQWRIVTNGVDGYQRSYTVHTYTPKEETSIENTNLNVGALIKSGSSTTSADLFIGGRKYAVMANFTPSKRISSHILTGVTVGTSLEPVMSFRVKSGASHAAVEAFGAETITTEKLEIQLRSGSDITGGTNPSWGDLDSTPTRETNLEVDTTATSVDTTTGALVERFLVGTSGTGSNEVGTSNNQNVATDIPDGQTVNICARSITANNATVDMIGKILEEY